MCITGCIMNLNQGKSYVFKVIFAVILRWKKFFKVKKQAQFEQQLFYSVSRLLFSSIHISLWMIARGFFFFRKSLGPPEIVCKRLYGIVHQCISVFPDEKQALCQRPVGRTFSLEWNDFQEARTVDVHGAITHQYVCALLHLSFSFTGNLLPVCGDVLSTARSLTSLPSTWLANFP